MGFGCTPEKRNQLLSRRSAPSACSSFFHASVASKPRSVTTSGRRSPIRSSRPGSSAKVPGPNRVVVGNEKLEIISAAGGEEPAGVGASEESSASPGSKLDHLPPPAGE